MTRMRERVEDMFMRLFGTSREEEERKSEEVRRRVEERERRRRRVTESTFVEAMNLRRRG